MNFHNSLDTHKPLTAHSPPIVVEKVGVRGSAL